MIKTVLWDADGTLFDFTYSEKNALLITFSELGYDLSDEDVKVYSAINDSYWTKFDNGEIQKSDIYERRLSDFFDYLKVPVSSRPTVERVNTRYQTALGETYLYFDSALETVTALSGKCRQYIVTNGSTRAQVSKLRISGLDKIMDGVFISESMGLKKPDKEFFEECFKAIDGFDPDEAIIIGDSLTSDMKGGNNAGIINCWYNPAGKKNDSDVRVDHEIKNLCEVLGVIDKINNEKEK